MLPQKTIKLSKAVTALLFAFIGFHCSSVAAFSTTPNDAPYVAPDWENSTSTEDDANFAIKHKDLRLLGFAKRGYDIPGVEKQQARYYSELCGVRFFDGLGDAVKAHGQLAKMRDARAYATIYNKIILGSCTRTKI